MNKDNYKKAIDQIRASDKLKRETLNKIRKKEKKQIPYLKYLTACAMFMLVFFLSTNYLDIEKYNNTSNKLTVTKKDEVAKVENDLPRFKSMEELKVILKESGYRNIYTDNITLDSSMATNSELKSEATIGNSAQNTNTEHSTTNVQVENVDEADIVKTDGKYIYYVVESKVFIIDANSLEILSVINDSNKEKNYRFYPSEIFINKDKLIVFGNATIEKMVQNRNFIKKYDETEAFRDYAVVDTKTTTKAIIYDITDRTNPIIKRELELDGYYSNSRMIDDNVYFISEKYTYYYDGIKDFEILPIYSDTVLLDKEMTVPCTDIVYFDGTESSNFTMVAGFNINDNEPMYVETFFGASDMVYASEKNLYLIQAKYGNYFRNEYNTIYKFNLDNSQIKLQCSADIPGDINNQFSLDEYEGNLRIATTVYKNDTTLNNLYILDENLEKIGEVEDLAKGEKIYSVRFIGKIGYVVTFKEIDPLFVIDLSNPRKPIVKGELKIPGYSSYLHPYDETHIIGIGYNTESNGNGGVINSNMKMSMFDVSDLENPKEMFNVNIGIDYAYSDLLYNHKALFYNKSENLIGFPILARINKRNYDIQDSFIIFKIDLENGFEKYGEIIKDNNYDEKIKRAIYIGDILYTLSNSEIISYDLNTLEKIKENELIDEDDMIKSPVFYVD